MRVAIPVRDGLITGHFGKTETILLVDIDHGSIIDQLEMNVPEGSRHHELPAFLLQQGVTHVIAGTMGQPMLKHLTRLSIPTIAGATGSPAEAIAAFLAGTLKSDESAVHEHQGSHDQH